MDVTLVTQGKGFCETGETGEKSEHHFFVFV
jgi:hypothetical protein